MAATLPAVGTSLSVNWYLFGPEEVKGIKEHHRQIQSVATYARRVGKAQVKIVSDDSEEDPGWGFRAVNFLHNGQTVTVRSIFEIQYHYS